LHTDAAIEPAADLAEVGRATRIALFRLMLLQRCAEDRIMALYRQGRISGSVYTGRGQEAVAAACGLALGPDDVVAPLNRELACHFSRGVAVAHVFRNFLGRGNGPTFGRDGNMHFGVPERNVFPLVSMLGCLCPVAVGAALAFKRRREPRVAMTFWGDGAMSTGDVHEGLGLAGVLNVPVVFVIQSNQYAYSTPTERQMRNTNIAERLGGGWSIPCERVDGTDAIAVHSTALGAVARARSGAGPQALEALTLRGHGHAAHDGALYVSDELRAKYGDPVERLALRLALDGMTEDEVADLRAAAERDVAAGLAEAEADPAPDPAELTRGLYAAPVGPGPADAIAPSGR
jgi:TPP-dependent pyruvate/acetoin dehydrogenase alpha subunit